LPASAAAAGTVGIASGWPAGGAAKIDNVLSAEIKIEIGNERISWNLDSIHQATFIPSLRSLICIPGELCRAGRASQLVPFNAFGELDYLTYGV